MNGTAFVEITKMYAERTTETINKNRQIIKNTGWYYIWGDEKCLWRVHGLHMIINILYFKLGGRHVDVILLFKTCMCILYILISHV